MIKNFKLLALTLVMSLGCLNGFAAELIGAEIFNTNNKLKYKIVDIDQYSKTGTCYILSNNLPASTTALDIEQTFVWTVSGEIGSVSFTADVEWTVIGIGDQAFKGLNFLKTVKVPATVQYIGMEAFLGCGVIEKFSIAGYEDTEKSDLETIGNFAFGNTGLKEIDLSGCPKLNFTAGNFPFTPTATMYNEQLAKVTLPAELESVGIAFRNCAALEEINLEDTQAYFLVGGLNPDNTGAFGGCASLKSITIPADAVAPIEPTTVGNYAFYGCKKLEEVTFKGKLATASLADKSFSDGPGKGATSIKKLTFDGELQAGAIPANIFDDSQATLAEIYFNGDITEAAAIAASAFDGFSALTVVDFNGDITATGAVAGGAFQGSGKVPETLVVSFNGDITATGAVATNAFQGANLITLNVANLSIQAGGIAAGAFKDCAALATVNYGDLLIAEAIPANMFDDSNVKLTTLNFNNDLTVEGVIAANAFAAVPLTVVNFNGAIKTALWQSPFKPNAFNEAGYKENTENIAEWWKTTKGFVVTFNGDITAAGNIGAGSFSNSYVKEVVIGENAKVAEFAFAKQSLAGTLDYYYDTTDPARIYLFSHFKYLPKDADAKMIFAYTGDESFVFNSVATADQDVVLTTTEKVKFLYEESVASAVNIYRVKYQVVSYQSDLNKDINSDNYYGKFTPKPTQYIIPRYQKIDDEDVVVTVYSAYYDKNRFGYPEYEEDGKTLKSHGNLDLYMNPLRLQTVKDFNGENISAYVVDANEVVIIRSTKDKFMMFQDVDDYPGSIQTIAGLSAHKCNDLRYSNADRNEWAVQNNYTDDYTADPGAPYAYDPDNNYGQHNVLKNYPIWVWLNPAKRGFAFGRYNSLYTGDVYVLGVSYAKCSLNPTDPDYIADPAARLNVIWTDGSGDDDQVTAILNKVTVKQQSSKEGIYTLQGVRTDAARKGVYIKDGKKVIVK